MLRSFVFILIFLICLPAMPAKRGVPYLPELDSRLDAIESLSDTEGIELASGKIIVGDSSGNGNAVSMSSDATISNTGALTIANDAVNAAKIAAGGVTEADTLAQSAEGLHLKRIARVTYDVASDLGTIGAHLLGVSLPAKALIQRSYYYVVTQFVDGGAGTVALHCEDANNILTAEDVTGQAAASIQEGNQDGTAANMTAAVASACEVTATVAGAEQTAGKLILFIEYQVVE